MFHKYVTLRRPPAPGAIPMKGLEEVTTFNCRQKIGKKECWGVLAYNRQLTQAEINDYELATISSCFDE